MAYKYAGGEILPNPLDGRLHSAAEAWLISPAHSSGAGIAPWLMIMSQREEERLQAKSSYRLGNLGVPWSTTSCAASDHHVVSNGDWTILTYNLQNTEFRPEMASIAQRIEFLECSQTLCDMLIECQGQQHDRYAGNDFFQPYNVSNTNILFGKEKRFQCPAYSRKIYS